MLKRRSFIAFVAGLLLALRCRWQPRRRRRQDLLLGLAWRPGRPGLDLLPRWRQPVGRGHGQHREHLVPQRRCAHAPGGYPRCHRGRRRRHRHQQPRPGQPGRGRRRGQRRRHPHRQHQHAGPDGQTSMLTWAPTTSRSVVAGPSTSSTAATSPQATSCGCPSRSPAPPTASRKRKASPASSSRSASPGRSPTPRSTRLRSSPGCPTT